LLLLLAGWEDDTDEVNEEGDEDIVDEDGSGRLELGTVGPPGAPKPLPFDFSESS